MLEVLRNSPDDRHGEGKIAGDTAYNGMFCWISGFDSEGYTTLKVPYDSSQSVRAVYPINKYYYPEDFSDTSDAVDKRKSGDQVVYYSGEGDYITDQFVASTFPFLNSSYWNSIESGLSSAHGAKITSPGTSTSVAAGILGFAKCWVCSSVNALAVGGPVNPGMLVGSSDGIFITDASKSAQDGFVARVMGVYGADSATAKLHVRLAPNPRGLGAGAIFVS